VRDTPPALILLPGLDGTGKLYVDFLAELGPRFETRVIAYPKTTPLGYDELEHLVRAALPRDRAYVLCGESFSGPLAIRIAAGGPPSLAGLILCATFSRNPFPRLGWARPLAPYLPLKALPRWIRAPLMWGSFSPMRAPSGLERAVADVSATVLRRRIAELLEVDESAALRRVASRTLVLRALRDRVISRATTRHMLDALPYADVADIDGPHLLLQTRPAECAAAVSGFLRSLTGRMPAGVESRRFGPPSMHPAPAMRPEP